MALTYTELRDHVSEYLGFGSTYADAGSAAQTQIDRAVQSGLREFYRPVQVDTPDQHYWSFLKTSKAVTIAADATSTVYETASDEDDTVIIGDGIVTAPSSRAGAGVELLVYQRIQQLISQDDFTGVPRQACLIDGNLLSWPKADQQYTVTFEVVRMPGVSATDPIFGATEHAETIKYSCLAASERMYMDTTQGPMANHYRERLMQAVAGDRENTTAENFTNTNVRWGDGPPRSYRRMDNGVSYVPASWE